MKNNIVLFLLVALLIVFVSAQQDVIRGQGAPPSLPLPNGQNSAGAVPNPPQQGGANNNSPPRPGTNTPPQNNPPVPVLLPPNPFVNLQPAVKPGTIFRLPPAQNFTFVSGNFIVTIPVNGRVPKYYLSEKGSNNTYVFTFDNIIEMVHIHIGRIDTWIPVPQSAIILKNLKWSITNTSTSFTLTGFCPFKRFTTVSLVNKFQTGVIGGVCLPSVRPRCISECVQSCTNVSCSTGCDIAQNNNVDSCYIECNGNGFGSSCVESCLKLIDCVARGCSNNLKVDLILQNYRWLTPKIIKESRLVFNYNVDGRNSNKPSRAGNTLTFGNFWVRFNTSSYVLPSTCNACGDGNCLCGPSNSIASNITSSTNAQNKTSIQIFFSRFPSRRTLINDPNLGLTTPWFNPRALTPLNSQTQKNNSSPLVFFSYVLMAILLTFTAFL